ncbi:cysteine desulfurase, partial [Patescibacteria group bacterium]|nr:cysteine desulfurase [Patescibacteria group bacterium]
MLPKPKKIRDIYFDHAAATYMDPAVLKVMLPFFGKNYGNPSALYRKGREANGVLNDARRSIAKNLHALPENIYFTSGGTESDNLAIYGIARAYAQNGKHIVSIGIEHHAVLHPLEDLKKQGWEITYVKIDERGIVKAKDVINAIRPDTVLVTIMYANNEIGTIEPIAEIGREILRYRKQNNSHYPYFHTDACQAAGYLDLDVEKLHVDLLTINGSKIYGPKGMGLLYVRRAVKLNPILLGGSQEKKMRAGTENVPGIVGLAKALEIAQSKKSEETKRMRSLAEYLWKRIHADIPEVKLNGPEIGEVRLPNNLNITFFNVEGEATLLYLDEYGIMASTGSACTADSLDPSHVLTAIGLPYEFAHGSLRFSLGRVNNKADIDYMMKYLPAIVGQLREMSSVNMGKT